MSKSPSVLIAVSDNKQSLKSQSYKNLSITYNPSELSSIDSEKIFYRNILTNEAEIYGFMPSNINFTDDHSIQKIVDFFQKHERVEVLLCDILHDHGFFKRYEYIHPIIINSNLPFFIRKSLKQHINFDGKAQILSHELNKLKSMGYIIFHIAEPLIYANEGYA